MTTDQFTADRERIAGEMNKGNDRAWSAWEFTSLDCAIRAFEVLCEPRGWCLALDSLNGWHAMDAESDRDAIVVETPPTRDHAADVCRLICEVLEREANPPENQCPECRMSMVRSGKVWKCLNCGAEKEPRQ